VLADSSSSSRGQAATSSHGPQEHEHGHGELHFAHAKENFFFFFLRGEREKEALGQKADGERSEKRAGPVHFLEGVEWFPREKGQIIELLARSAAMVQWLSTRLVNRRTPVRSLAPPTKKPLL
jgi:hypothetical protein